MKERDCALKNSTTGGKLGEKNPILTQISAMLHLNVNIRGIFIVISHVHSLVRTLSFQCSLV